MFEHVLGPQCSVTWHEVTHADEDLGRQREEEDGLAFAIANANFGVLRANLLNLILVEQGKI